MKQFMERPELFGQYIRGRKLSIICADDVYFNLEALRVIFRGMGLLDYCHFVATGRQLIDCCAKNLYELEEGEDAITIVIMDYEMP